MAIVNGKKPHVLVVPFPAQGHVTPLMKLSRLIAQHGIKVTFVNTEYIHEKILNSAAILSHDDQDMGENIVLTSIPDGLAPEDDRKDAVKLAESLKSTMAGSLADLIEKINCSNSSDEKISCIIADITVEWILEIAERMGAEPVVFTPASAASMAVVLHIPKLIQQGYLDVNGNLKGSDIISLPNNIPPWRKDELAWSFPDDLKTQKFFFECTLNSARTANQAKWLLCNTFYELESSACALHPKLLPVGPLHQTNHHSSFYPQDASCLSWLDEKPAGSVIYVSFGSVAVLSQHQLDELAFGLELSGRPFLWVVRSDLANGSRMEFPNGFLERVSVASGVGKLVEWAPQEKVLSHHSVACFLSHCGWNSTVEGLSSGVPFLCWPYFTDQFGNQKYICDEWRIGLRISPDEKGIRSRYEIKKKIEIMFSDDYNLRANALRLKEMAEESVDQGGSSSKNLEKFIGHLKE